MCTPPICSQLNFLAILRGAAFVISGKRHGGDQPKVEFIQCINVKQQGIDADILPISARPLHRVRPYRELMAQMLATAGVKPCESILDLHFQQPPRRARQSGGGGGKGSLITRSHGSSGKASPDRCLGRIIGPRYAGSLLTLALTCRNGASKEALEGAGPAPPGSDVTIAERRARPPSGASQLCTTKNAESCRQCTAHQS